MNYQSRVLNLIMDVLRDRSEVHAVWEGGSKATGFGDEYSDIDLCVVADSPIQAVIQIVEGALEKEIGVKNTWQTAKSAWGEGIVQRVIVLKNAPEFFSVDLAVMDRAVSQAYEMFLEVERHGTPHVLFDKSNILRERHTDAAQIFARQKERAEELRQGFPIFKSLVLKEIRRGNSIDAIAFYQTGLLRPLVEVMGMTYRPYRFDFGMRYLHRDFPEHAQNLIQELSYVSDVSQLADKIARAETAFEKAVSTFRDKKTLDSISGA